MGQWGGTTDDGTGVVEEDYSRFAGRLHLLGAFTIGLTIVLPHWDPVNEWVLAGVVTVQLAFAALAFRHRVLPRRLLFLMPLPGLVTISVAVWTCGPGAGSATAAIAYSMLTIGAFSFLHWAVGVAYIVAACSVYAALLVHWRVDGWPAQVGAVASVSFTIGFSAGWLNRRLRVLARREQESARRVERMQGAFATLTTSPQLDVTVDSVVDAAVRAVGAIASAVVMIEGDEMHVAGAIGVPAADDAALPRGGYLGSVTEIVSPVTDAMRDGRSVVVADVWNEARYRTWLDQWRARYEPPGPTAAIAVPLRTGGSVIGAMNTFFAGRIPEGDDTVRMLEAFAEQVIHVIVRAQAYEREREVAARLVDADRSKSEFLALVSHELRTPLTSAKGFVDTALFQWDDMPDAAKRGLLERASANAETIARLIEQLLEYSRLESESERLVTERLEVAPIVREVVGDLAPIAAHRIVVDVPPDLVAAADRHAIGAVVRNLVANAVKYAPEQTEIRIDASADAREVLLCVSDQGPGIPLTDQARLFERFFRAGDGTTGGTGLGLPIARRYVEAMGGRMWVESEPGHGATFVVALPDGREHAGAPVVHDRDGGGRGVDEPTVGG